MKLTRTSRRRGQRVAFDPTDSQRVYAGALSGTGFFKSTDGGLTWSSRHFGSSAVYVIAVAVDPWSPNVVYVGTQNEGFFKSTDYGDTWVAFCPNLPNLLPSSTLAKPTGETEMKSKQPPNHNGDEKMQKYYYAIALSHNTKDDDGKTFNDKEDSPSRRRVVVNHQEILDKMSAFGYDLVAVDDGIAYFKQRPL